MWKTMDTYVTRSIRYVSIIHYMNSPVAAIASVCHLVKVNQDKASLESNIIYNRL